MRWLGILSVPLFASSFVHAQVYAVHRIDFNELGLFDSRGRPAPEVVAADRYLKEGFRVTVGPNYTHRDDKIEACLNLARPSSPPDPALHTNDTTSTNDGDYPTMVLRFPWGARLVQMNIVAHVSNVDQMEYTLKTYADDALTQLIAIQTRYFPALSEPTTQYVEALIASNVPGTRAVLIECIRRHPTNPNIAPILNEVVIDDLVFETAPYETLVQITGQAVDAANAYAESTTIQATVIFPPGGSNAGQRHDGWTGQIKLTEESGTLYYDGLSGASQLPVTIDAANGLATATIRSVSNTADRAAGPPIDARVVVSGIRTGLDQPIPDSVPFPVEQWFDADTNGVIDWLDRQASTYLSCFKTKSGEVGTVASKTTRISQLNVGNSCGYTDPGLPAATTIQISPWCRPPSSSINEHRANVNHQLSGTVIHESRHSWQESEFARNVGTNNDGNSQTPKNDDDPNPLGGESGDQLAEQVTFSSANIILESVSGHGDAVYDFNMRGEPLGTDMCEMDAKTWEAAKKDLCP